MAIIKLPDNISPNLTCAICGAKLTPAQATAGLLDAHQRQAFACISHFAETTELITGWADFMATERRQPIKRGK